MDHRRIHDASWELDADDGLDEDALERAAASEGKGRALVCRACAARITTRAAAIEVDGHHRHTFFNPAGVAFRVACFRSAPGCAGVGVSSDEFTWFAGHRWQIAVCHACAEHLGWFFSGASSFVALIEDRIADAEENDADA